MRNSPLIRKVLVLLAASSVLTTNILVVPPAIAAILLNPPCSSVTVNTNLILGTTTGIPVTFTASSTGCIAAEYQFYLQPPGGAWTAQGSYSTNNTFAWTTTTPGTWGVGARARAAGTTVSYDVFYLGTFTVWYGYCGEVTMSAPGDTPQPPGTVITFVANIPQCNNTPQFRYLVQPPGGAWRTVRGYSPTPGFSWDTTGLAPGIWHVSVWVRQLGSRASYDGYTVVEVVLQPLRCLFITVDATPSPQVPGTTVVFSPVASECVPQFEFWLMPPGGAWTMVQSYGVSISFSWNTTGLADGRYQVGIWARRSGSTNNYDIYQTLTYYIGT